MLLEKTVKIKKSNLFNYFVKKTVNFPSSTFNLGIPMEIELENGTWKAYFHTRRSRVWKSALKLPFSNEIPWKFQDWKWKKENSWFFWQNNWTDCFFWFLLFFRSSNLDVIIHKASISQSPSPSQIFNDFKASLKVKQWISNTWP